MDNSTNDQTMQYGDNVIFYYDRNNFNCVQLKENKYTNTQYGRFKHEFFVGKKYGEKIQSQNDVGFLYALKLTPDFFTLTLNHQTQILYQHDIAQVIFNLQLQRGQTIIESGTGSGSLTFSLSQAVGNEGHVYTFEYNQQRAEIASDLFQKLKLKNITNVLKEGFDVDLLKDIKVDAVFLDLPQPYDVIEFASKKLKRFGRLCSFSPCMEQIQATSQAMVKQGFDKILMIENIERKLERKKRNIKNPFEQRQEQEYSFFFGEKMDKGHTGYLLFGRKMFNQIQHI